jgi:hypothetical protein
MAQRESPDELRNRYEQQPELGATIKIRAVLRAISNSLLSALMVATLLWGGCVACPQFFMFPTVKKDCCKAGHCGRSKSQKTTPAKECKHMPLEPNGSLHLVCAELPIVGTAAADVILSNAVHRPPTDPVEAVEHSPPDFQALNATFLI